MIKLWSETKPESKKVLKPDLGQRSWDKLTKQEKFKIWLHLKYYFFEATINTKNYEEYKIEYLESIQYFSYDSDFRGEIKKKIIIDAIEYMNNSYMVNCYTPHYLLSRTLETASSDFFYILLNLSEDIVLELFSAYSIFLYQETKKELYTKNFRETEEQFSERKIIAKFEGFDKFSKKLNDIFSQFGIKWILTRDGFIPRQDEKIIEEIYKPVLHYLSDPKWQKVNTILFDAFSDYRKNTPQGYSGCVTNTIAAVEAYLQILVEGKTGGTKFSPLISNARRENIIPNDVFTGTIFKNIDSIFSRERQATGDAHPKEEYATEKNARIILNLAMIFIQHCAQK